jgi:hypothetical protein
MGAAARAAIWPESKAITCSLCHCCSRIGEMVSLINQQKERLESIASHENQLAQQENMLFARTFVAHSNLISTTRIFYEKKRPKGNLKRKNYF